jgi:hypothetical protein
MTIALNLKSKPFTKIFTCYGADTTDPNAYLFRSLGHFLTNVCAMVGGVYTVAGILDSIIHRAVQSAHHRMMGKVR